MTIAVHIKTRFKIWIQAVRVFSFTASMTPVVLGAVLAFAYEQDVAWILFPLVVVCSLLLHAGTNVVSEYFDFVKKVDTDYTFGSSRVIVDNILKASEVIRGGIIILMLGATLGLILVAVRGWPMLALGAIGLVGGFFYTGKPFGFKYIALGDVMVFILMGPLMVIGSFFTLTGKYNNNVLYISLPVGFLVAAILYANNLRDIKHDTEAGIKTFENLIGYARAKTGYYAIIAAAYIAVIAMIITKVLPLWSVLVFLTVPLAAKNFNSARRSQAQNPQTIALLDVHTAQLHLLFGVLLCLSIVIGTLRT